MKRLFSEYGSVLVFLLLCGYYSVVTWSEQHPTNAAAGRSLAQSIIAEHGVQSDTLIIVRDTVADRIFAKAILMITSELPEALGMADRILVMREGRINGEIREVSTATQEQIMELAVE